MGLFLRLLLITLILIWILRWFRERTASSTTRSTSGPNTADPYSVLGIKKGATDQEIKSAFKEAIQKYHPDKVEHLGEELKELSRRKTQEINEAYRKLIFKK